MLYALYCNAAHFYDKLCGHVLLPPSSLNILTLSTVNRYFLPAISFISHGMDEENMLNNQYLFSNIIRRSLALLTASNYNKVYLVVS